MTKYDEVSPEFAPDDDCQRAKLAEECSNDINSGCIGFWQTYAKQMYYKWIDNLPECISDFVNIGNEEETFPLFNNLIDELVKIQKLLKEQK